MEICPNKHNNVLLNKRKFIECGHTFWLRSNTVPVAPLGLPVSRFRLHYLFCQEAEPGGLLQVPSSGRSNIMFLRAVTAPCRSLQQVAPLLAET